MRVVHRDRRPDQAVRPLLPQLAGPAAGPGMSPEISSAVPDLAEVLAARRRIEPYLRPTPLYRYPALDQTAGARVWVKHENHQPVGAFKVRGGVNLVSQLTEDERRRGVIAASTGNHGQSGNEPALVAGVATCTLEILEARPDIEAIVVPVGGGSGASGACVVAKAVRPSIEVIGVQSEAAPAAYRSWRSGTLVEDTTSTFAEGLATRTAFELPQQIMRDLLDDFVLVSEDALKAATRLMIEKTRNLVEPAGAAALAAVLGTPDRFAGRKVAIICSGGNISPAQLAGLWPHEPG